MARNLQRRLRRIIHLVGAIAIVIAAVGFLPGTRVYEDSNECLGRAFASLAVIEHGGHADGCTPRYDRLVKERSAGGIALVGYLVVLLLPGVLVFRRSRKRYAWLWTAWAIATTFAVLALTFDLQLFARVVVLWPARVVWFGLGTLLVLLLVVMPLVTLFTRERPGPEARLVRPP